MSYLFTFPYFNKYSRIYTTPQWAATIRAARPGKPYVVHALDVQDFYDFKALSEQLKNFDVNSDGEKVYWRSIRSYLQGLTSK